MPDPGRRCSWCAGPIGRRTRSDRRTCSQSCRQAEHRFTRDSTPHPAPVAPSSYTGPIHLEYADPPYPGLSARYYRTHPDYAGEVNHLELLDLLAQPGRNDGWALSTNAESLGWLLPAAIAAEDRHVRVAAWVKGGRTNIYAAGPLQSWEPVIYAGGRPNMAPRFDSLVHTARPRHTDPANVTGAKPATFARWLYSLLGALPGDTLTDLFPGSAGMSRAFNIYTAHRRPTPTQLTLLEDPTT